MSLGKLLTTGKSLVGLHNANGRYHMRKGALPKFESSKNPFASKPQAEVVEREPQLPKLTSAEIAAANLKKTQLLPVIAETKVVAQQELQPEKAAPAMKQVEPTKPAEPVKVATPVDGWLKKINPMVWLGNRKPVEPKPVVPRFSKGQTPIQGELSLDNIKVMRNDLSETDVEVVPAKSRPAAPQPPGNAAAAVMTVPELPSAKRALAYLNDRLLGKN
jgi:hypothetical protein